MGDKLFLVRVALGLVLDEVVQEGADALDCTDVGQARRFDLQLGSNH